MPTCGNLPRMPTGCQFGLPRFFGEKKDGGPFACIRKKALFPKSRVGVVIMMVGWDYDRCASHQHHYYQGVSNMPSMSHVTCSWHECFMRMLLCRFGR